MFLKGEKLKVQFTRLGQELDKTKEEVTKYKNEKTVLSLGIKGKYVGAAMYEASKLVNEKTPFDKAIEKVANDFPEWKDSGIKEEKAIPNIAALSGTNNNLAGRKIRRNTKNT